jgi:hypothetical protein
MAQAMTQSDEPIATSTNNGETQSTDLSSHSALVLLPPDESLACTFPVAASTNSGLS